MSYGLGIKLESYFHDQSRMSYSISEFIVIYKFYLIDIEVFRFMKFEFTSIRQWLILLLLFPLKLLYHILQTSVKVSISLPNSANKMDQPQNNIQKIRHQKPQYDLQVTYSSGQTPSQQGHGKQEKLSINLRVKTSPKIKAYRVQYTQNNAPRELLSSFTSLDIVFYCLSQEDGFEVNLANGAIVVKVECEIRGRKFLKQCQINLTQYELSEYQLMMQQIHQTQIQVQILKQTNCDYTQKIKAQYEQKLSAQARKYEQQLKQMKLEQIKAKQKQKQLQTEVQKLKHQVWHLNNQIQRFVQRQTTQVQKFVYQIQRLQAEHQKIYQDLEDVLIFKRGYQGRKRHHDNDERHHDNYDRHHDNDGDVKNRSQIGSASPYKDKQQKQGNCRGWVDISQEKSSSLWEKSAKTNRFHKDSLQVIDQFEFKQNKITVNKKSKWRQLIFNTRIEKQKTQYKIKIIKLVNQNMRIGLIDYSQADIPNKKKYIIYYHSNGRTIGCEDCYSCDIQGSGYKQGDIVNMTVYLEKLRVEWRVNGELKATCHANSILGQKIGRFFPYVDLIDRCDCIQWTEI